MKKIVYLFLCGFIVLGLFALISCDISEDEQEEILTAPVMVTYSNYVLEPWGKTLDLRWSGASLNYQDPFAYIVYYRRYTNSSWDSSWIAADQTTMWVFSFTEKLYDTAGHSRYIFSPGDILQFKVRARWADKTADSDTLLVSINY